MAGKADWMAAGLPTEGTAAGRRRVTDVMDRAPATCLPSESVSEVVARLRRVGRAWCVVINEHRVVMGRLRLDRLEPAGTALVGEVMEPGPVTVRADADPDDTFARMRQRGAASLIVTTPDGVLLGAVDLSSQGGTGAPEPEA